MKRTLTFLMTALFLCMGMTVKAQTFPETSTAEAPKYYTIASFNRGGYLTNVGEGKSVEHVATTKGSIWYFTKADENGGLHFCNFNGGYLAADKTVSETAGVWYVLPNGVNTDGVSISSTNPISGGSCIDANNYNTGVGAWHPSASDWHGTTWVFAEVTDFSVIFNVDEAKAAAKAEIDVLASEPLIYSGDAAAAKANVDAVQAEGTSAEQLVAAIDAVNQCVVDYKNAAYQALEGKYFTFATPARPNGFMKLEGNRVVGLAEASSPAAVWQFVHADNAVKVFNPYTGKYLGEPGNNSAEVPVTANAEDAAAYQLVINDKAEKAEAKIKFTSNGKSVHMAGGSVLVRWNDGGASEWTVAEISEFSGIASLHKAAALAAVEAYSALPEIFETAAAKEAINAVSATDWSAFAAIDEAAGQAIPTGIFAFQATSGDNHRDSVWVSANMETSKAIGAVELDENGHWTLKPANGGTFYIYNVKNSLYMGNPGGNCTLTESPAAAYTVEVVDAEKNVVEFKCAGETLHASNHDDDKLMNYDGDEAASRWTIVAIVEEPEEPTPDPTPDPEEPEETVDLDMTHKVSRDWEGKSGNVTIDGIAMSERYEGNADPVGDQLWQTVTGLENGKYTVKLWANARVAWVGSPAADGQEELTYIFANNVEKSIAVLLNPGTNGNVLRTLEGVEVTDGTLRMGMTKKAAGSNWHSIQIESLTLHATKEVVVNIAKAELQATIDEANAVSPVTDALATAIAAAQAVYDNSSDKDEVIAATAALKTAVVLANNTNAVAGASEENPVLTTFVVNGTFDSAIAPWKSTTGAQNQALASNQQGAFTGNFFENWNGSNYTGKLYQVIENIPNGVYELSIAAFVETFDASAQFVYANADKVALTTGAPTAYTVRTIVENNTIEVGFEQTAAVNRWCGIDNISLTYLGEASNEAVVNAAKEAFTAAYEEFGAALTACQAMMLKMSFYEIDDAAYQLNEQLETTTDVDALNAMAETLAEATASLKEINEVYAGYDVFVQKFKAAAEISEPTTTEAAELLEFNMYGGAGMQATSLEALAQAVETIKADYFTYIANAKLLDGNMFDLTYLIQNPDFNSNIDGWTCVNAGHNGGAGYNNVGGIAEIALWGAESWEASISQTLNELPNGKYIVKAAWMAASGIEMTFVANEGETKVTGIGDQGGNIDNDGNVVEMGQGFRGWQYVEVEGVVVDGTLTITVNSSSTTLHTWSNADAFELYYAGTVVEEPEQPVVDPNDYTSYIKNADLSTSYAEGAVSEDWNLTNSKGIKEGYARISGKVFDFSQTITLPAGQYKMTAKAAYRFGADEQAEYNAIQAGDDTHLAKLYAATASYKYEANVMNRYEGASENDYANGSGSVTVNNLFVPNSSAAVKAWFDANQYVNELVFNVQEDGEVKIGIAKNVESSDYTNIGAWTLTRLGDAEADPEVEEPTPDPDPTPDPEETIDMDLTHLVGTSRDAWIGNNGGPVNIDGISLPEKYETTTATLGDVMWQTVTGLENGKYTVELWANARYTSGRGFNSDAADGALDFTYLYANNVEISIEVYHNGGLNSGKSYKLEGVEVTDGTLKMGMTKKAAGSNWHTIQIKSLIYHAPANAALDMAKVDLQAALDAANAVEPKKDDFVAAIAAAQGVYDNSKSVEEIEAATATLLEATKLAILGNASPSNPVLTDFVVNGTFDAGTTGWQTTTGAQNQGTATNQGGAFSVPFFENWNPSAVTGKIYQVIENVPNGIYDLSICAFVNNFNGAVQFVYANADKVALTSGEPTAYVVRTIVVNNTIEVGFEQTEAVANWMGIDNVSLTYLGEYSNDAEVNMAKANFTAAYDEFNAALAACQAMMLKTNFYEVADAADQLNAQLESTTDIEALNAMVAQLNEATASLNEINAVYAEYDVYVQKFKAAAEWSEPLTTEAAELLEYNMYGGAGMQAMSIDALKQAIEQIKADYVAYAGNAKLYDGNMFDFTYLIQNPDFEANLDGWTGDKANRIGGEGYDGVGGIAEIGEWGATSWNASMSQAITGLPNGKYVVKAAWMSATGIQMTFAANAGETTVTGIGDQGGNIAKDGSVVEMGQGHRGWQYVEVEGLVEDGTLTILVSSSSETQYQWSNADAFELYYAGDDCLYDLDEPIEGEWEDVTNKPNEYGWTIIDHAELLSLGDYWVATNNTRYDEERGVMEFVAGENAAASLIQEWCPFGQATYRLTGKAFHNGAVNAVMFVGDQTVEIPAAAEGATFENAEEYFTTFSIEFTCESAWGTQLNVGYSCEFDNAEDFLVVGGLKLEEKKSTTIKSIFMETIMALESLGYEVMNMEALYASQQEVMADAMPIYEAIMGGQKVLKSEVEQSIEDMQAIIAELNPVAAYYKGEFMDALYAAEDFKWTLDEASQAYTDLEAAIAEASDVAAVTTVAELEAKVAALEELMKLIETGIDSIEAEVETVIYDLSGRRVYEMTKGVYIVNGKKVIKK